MVNHLWGEISTDKLIEAVDDLRLIPEDNLPVLRAELLTASIDQPLGRFDVFSHIAKRPKPEHLSLLTSVQVNHFNLLSDHYEARQQQALASGVWYYDAEHKPQICWLYLQPCGMTHGNFSRALREEIHRRAGFFPDNVNTHFIDLSGLTHAQ